MRKPALCGSPAVMAASPMTSLPYTDGIDVTVYQSGNVQVQVQVQVHAATGSTAGYIAALPAFVTTCTIRMGG